MLYNSLYKPTINKKEEEKSLISSNLINNNFSQTKSLINPEKSKINQELIFFKNDILLDIRKIEETFNFKLTERNNVYFEQYDIFDKKLSELTERISKIYSLILDNNELTEKIKVFLKFQTQTENNLNRINAKIISVQKENQNFINNTERMIKENLRFPGVIGKNAKFLNFASFINYTMENFKSLNEFREEIRNLKMNELEKKIDKDISEIRASINDNYRSSVRLININSNELDKKLEELIKRNNENMNQNESKLKEIQNDINQYYSKYKTKYENLENSLNEKYNELIKEINNVKNIKNELSNEIKDINSYIEKLKSLNDNITYNYNIKTNNFGRNKKNTQSNHSNKFSYQDISTCNQKYNMVTNELINNNNNVLDNCPKSELEYKTEFISSNKINSIVLNRSESFEKIQENPYFQIRNINKDLLSFTQYKIKKKEDNKELFTNLNKTNKDKDLKRSNYSISNIANIKFKKVIIPENVSKRKINKRLNNSLPGNNGKISMSNDLTSSIHQKSIYSKDIKNSSFNFSKINKNKVQINKNRDIYLSHSARNINRKVEIKNQNKINSLVIMKPKSKNNILKNLDFFNKGKKINLSFEKRKNLKDEQYQIGFRKTINLKSSIKELLLINSRTIKKNKKIEF